MNRRAIAALLLVLAVAWPVVAVATGDAFLLRLGARLCIFALAAVALDLVLGFGGLVSLGHAAFMGLGAYAVGILAYHTVMEPPLWGVLGTDQALLAWPAAMLLGGAFAALTGLCVLRTRAVAFIMITLAFAQMVFYLAIALRDYGGEDGMTLLGRSRLPGLDLESPLTFYAVCATLLALAALLVARLAASPFGEVLRAAAENERRTRALGYPVIRYRLAAWVVSGALTGLAGALLANASGFVGPSYLSWLRSGELIFMVVLGGMGTVVGPILGAVVFLLLEELLPTGLEALRPGWGEHWQLALGVLLLLVVLGGRGGLVALLERPWRRPRVPAATPVEAP